MPVVDMTGVSTEYTPVDGGTYEAKLVGFKNAVSSKDNPMVKLTFEITEEGDFTGRKLTANRTLTPESLWSLKRDMLAIGADPDDIAGKFDTDELLPDLISNECRIEVTLSEPNEEGRRFNNVDKVLPLY